MKINSLCQYDRLPGICLLCVSVSSQLIAETISIDFNTFAYRGDDAEMRDSDPSFNMGGVWNQVYIPKENNGVLDVAKLKDSLGQETNVSMHIEAPEMVSWWTTGRNLMPISQVYRDYLGLPKGANIVIKGLRANTPYKIGIMGYPLSWGKVELTLNSKTLKLNSGLAYTDEDVETQKTAGILEVVSDGTGTLGGVVEKGSMWSGLHLTTDALKASEVPLVYKTPVPEVEPAPKFPPTEQVVYKTIGDVGLVMDIYRPTDFTSTDQRPAILFFHGGSWSGGWKTHLAPQCHYLASRGMVAITVEYRVSSRHDSNPANCLMDAKSAMRHVRKNAHEMGVNPDRIVAGGDSAGGHLAAALAYAEDFNEPGENLSVSCRPDALILFNPVIDNSPGGGYPYGPQPMKDNWKRWSPMHSINSKDAVPTIFFLGSEDHLIPVKIGEEYTKRTQEAGAEAELHIYPGVRHGLSNWGSIINDTLNRMDRFLAKHGFLESEPKAKGQ